MRRPRRLRISKNIRDSLSEVDIRRNQLISGLFIVEGSNVKREIKTMPGIYQMSMDIAVKEVSDCLELGISNFMIFGVPNNKTFLGEGAWDKLGTVPNTLSELKNNFGKEATLFADVCLCEYTDHGHCGILDNNGYVQNDLSLDSLAKAALTYAEAGADWVAPSNMMDLRVISIRKILDDNGFHNTSILSYSAKFASNYYGPFRDAANSAPMFADRTEYQLDYRGYRQALYELKSDEIQGADALMVKPALAYLDIVQRARQQTDLPLFVYNVSGEYSMVKIAANNGLIDERKIVIENLTAMRRAGADMIISYHAKDVAKNNWIM